MCSHCHVPVTAGEKSWLLRHHRQNSHWLLSGSDFTRVDENSGNSERATYNTAWSCQHHHNKEQQDIFAKLSRYARGSTQAPAPRAGSTSFLEYASYLLSDLLRGIVKQDVVESILWSSKQFCWGIPGQFKVKELPETQSPPTQLVLRQTDHGKRFI